MGRGNPNIKDHAHKGGRPKGSKDKVTKNLKQMVLNAAERLEKEDKSLYDIAKDEPMWFYANFVKPMLPKDVIVSGDEDNPLVNRIEFTLVRPEDS